MSDLFDFLITVALLVGILASFVYLLGAGYTAWVAYREER